MSDSGRVAALRSAVAALNGGDVDGYLQQFDPSCLRWVAGLEQPFTVTDVSDNLRQLGTAFEALRLDEDVLFGADGFVCARWRLRGIQTGEYMGIAPRRREIDVQTCEVYEFAGELVVATWTYGDVGQLFRQIGATSEERSVQ